MVASYKIRSILSPAQVAVMQEGQPSPTQSFAALRSARSRPARIDMEEEVTQSMRTVERAVENLAALNENCDYFKVMADDLREGLEVEKAERKSAKRLLAELEHDMRAERERAAWAEEHAAKCELTIKNLQRELDAIRMQTERLIGVVADLVPEDRASDISAAFDRLVA